MAESKTSENRLAAVDRQRRALELRRDGRTFEAIAAELGYRGPSGAYNAVQAGLKATLREPAEELRTLEAMRLDALMRGLWDRAVGGDLRATDRILSIMQRRARLLGLDAPKAIDVRGNSQPVQPVRPVQPAIKEVVIVRSRRPDEDPKAPDDVAERWNVEGGRWVKAALPAPSGDAGEAANGVLRYS